MDAISEQVDELVYYPESGYGFYPVKSDGVYDESYFEKYKAYTDTPMGRALNQARLDLVARHYAGPVVDIGIGCGDFVAAYDGAFGYDVNPAGIKWLKDNCLWADPYTAKVTAVTCWDSLEHIANPAILLNQVLGWVFVSIPIFENCEHILRSKHFRKDEHYLYFTHPGFVKYMAKHGFEMVEYNAMESFLGREDIGSYAFRRA